MITILNNNTFLKDTLGVKFNFCALIGKITPISILKDNTTNIFIGFKHNYQHYGINNNNKKKHKKIIYFFKYEINFFINDY